MASVTPGLKFSTRTSTFVAILCAAQAERAEAAVSANTLLPEQPAGGSIPRPAAPEGAKVKLPPELETYAKYRIVALLGEGNATSPAHWGVLVVAALAATAGVGVLARHHPEATTRHRLVRSPRR